MDLNIVNYVIKLQTKCIFMNKLTIFNGKDANFANIPKIIKFISN